MSRGGSIAIMQPYFLPYLGYWQLMNRVDKFVVYDDIQFSKSGWVHRNKYLEGSKERIFTLPLRKDSDFLYIANRELSSTFGEEKLKIRRKLEGAYRNAPHFTDGMAVFDECLSFQNNNLFQFVSNSIKIISTRLELKAEILISSDVGDTKSLRGQDRVISLCQILGAKEYINPIGGLSLYDHDRFEKEGIELKFNSGKTPSYDQMNKQFVPNLSILDSLMFSGIERVKLYLRELGPW